MVWTLEDEREEVAEQSTIGDHDAVETKETFFPTFSADLSVPQAFWRFCEKTTLSMAETSAFLWSFGAEGETWEMETWSSQSPHK